MSKAVDYFYKSAHQGYALAQNNLAVRYQRGEGVEKDISKAVYWYTQAVKQGHGMSEFNLKMLYLSNRISKEQLDKALAGEF